MKKIITGLSYHIDDSFFMLVKDESLMKNKDDGGYRPHFLCIQDKHNASIFWAVPQSTKIEKYELIIKKKKEKYGRCDTIIIGKYGGNANAFLIQNMFTVISKYIKHEHTIGENTIYISKNLQKEIESKVQRVLSLHRRGMSVMYADIDSIYHTMLFKLL